MLYTVLGKTGLRISRIALGTWQFGSRQWGYGVSYSRADCVEALRAAVEHGVNLVDTAEIYGSGLSEEIVGEAVKGLRERVVIATKVSPLNLTYDGVIKACGRSLRRLGVKTIDLYQIHHPNPLIPISGTMKAMEKLVEMGWISYIGVSNFSLKRLIKAQEALRREEIVSNQVKYNLLERDVERELLPYAEREGLTILAYSPLAQGLLTGKYTRERQPRDLIRKVNLLFANMERVEPVLAKLRELAGRMGVEPGQIALRWLISRENVSAIVGVKNVGQALSAAASSDIDLSREDYEELDRLSLQARISRNYAKVLLRLLS
ncbi:putative oxidoreductase [archaeon HR01]|nr:putative oxidoreductase [archaeon HR01]